MFESNGKKAKLEKKTQTAISHITESQWKRSHPTDRREKTHSEHSHQVCLFRPADLSAADERKEHKTKRRNDLL